MRVNRIIKDTLAEGPGHRFSIWVQGCPHRCSGCFAEKLWDYDGGYEMSSRELLEAVRSVEDRICGITFLGGEPFAYEEELAPAAQYIRSLGKNVITFTGYTYEYLKDRQSPLLAQTDLLIDGRFEEALLDYSRPLVGSSNQRFLFLTDRIGRHELETYKNRFEIRLSPDGKAQINGMGNIEKLKTYLKMQGDNR